MKGATTADYPTQWHRPPLFSNRWVKYMIYTALIAFFLWSLWESRVSLDRFLIGVEGFGRLVENAFPPNFGPEQRVRIYAGVRDSLAIALISTVLGIIVSIPVAIASAENISHPLFYGAGRLLISISRSFHSLILGIIIVAAVGFGALAGVITLTFASIGFYAKLVADEIEEMDLRQVDAIRATGASKPEVLVYGVLPQIFPRMVGLAVYLWDKHFRESTIIGIVGAGGIGQTLHNSFRSYEYDFSIAIIIVIVALVLLGEFISLVARRRVQ